jgi:transposase
LDKSIIRTLQHSTEQVVTVLKGQIKAIEAEIHQVIKEDENLERLNKIITSIDGVGFVTAAYVILTTGEFTTITDAKKFACYAGVVPFEHSSGTSYKTKARVSHKANKTMKKLLHLSAMSAIRMKGDLYDYYQRKVAEGKNKMSVVNAIRNKLVLRIFACVKQNRTFEKNYSYSLV